MLVPVRLLAGFGFTAVAAEAADPEETALTLVAELDGTPAGFTLPLAPTVVQFPIGAAGGTVGLPARSAYRFPEDRDCAEAATALPSVAFVAAVAAARCFRASASSSICICASVFFTGAEGLTLAALPGAAFTHAEPALGVGVPADSIAAQVALDGRPGAGSAGCAASSFSNAALRMAAAASSCLLRRAASLASASWISFIDGSLCASDISRAQGAREELGVSTEGEARCEIDSTARASATFCLLRLAAGAGSGDCDGGDGNLSVVLESTLAHGDGPAGLCMADAAFCTCSVNDRLPHLSAYHFSLHMTTLNSPLGLLRLILSSLGLIFT